MTDIDHILDKEGEISEDQLLQYLSGELSGEERHAVEKKMIDSQFVNDAIEGLQAISDPRHVQRYVADLNMQLKKQVSGRRAKKRRITMSMNWILLCVVIVLMLGVMAWLAIHFLQKR